MARPQFAAILAAALVLSGPASAAAQADPPPSGPSWPMLARAASYRVVVALEGADDSFALCGVDREVMADAFAAPIGRAGLAHAPAAPDLTLRLTATVASSSDRVCAVHLRYDVLHEGTFTLGYSSRQTRAGLALVSASTMLLGRPGAALEALISRQLHGLADGFVRTWRRDQEP